MKTHDLIQGSPEWKAYRREHRNASDAPAMMGCSPYKTRAELMREIYTGVEAEIDGGTQRRFDAGHRLEHLARPLAEEFVGADLYPVTGSADSGNLSASFDGLTLEETISFEHKHLNNTLRACMPQDSGDSIGNGFLPLYHRVQMEQQLLVSGAERVLFMASNWDADGNLIEERHCWYLPDLELRQQIVDGWAQFDRDLAAYVLPEAAPAAPVGKAPESLPALRIEITGEVTDSNLELFKATALGAIRSVNRVLRTDQDFADADKSVKWCEDVEDRLKAAKAHALSQTTSIDALFRTIDEISAEARQVRLDLEKLVTRRKTEVKEEAVSAACRALNEHIAQLNAELAPMRLKAVAADFAGAIKGKRSVANMQDALDQTLAQAKIDADAAARAIRANVATFARDAAGFEFLFADLGQLVHKAADDFTSSLQARIATHRANEEAKARQRAEAEARAVAQRQEAEARAAEQQRQQEEAKRIQAERDNAAALRTSLVPTSTMPPPATNAERIEAARGIVNDIIAAEAVADAIKASRPDEPATLKLGVICERLGITMTAAFVAETLQLKPARIEGSSRLYRESDFGRICLALQAHVERARRAHLEGVAA